MPITLDCPRCRSPLSVPSKLAGQYSFCPKCQGRFWVPTKSNGGAVSQKVHASQSGGSKTVSPGTASPAATSAAAGEAAAPVTRLAPAATTPQPPPVEQKSPSPARTPAPPPAQPVPPQPPQASSPPAPSGTSAATEQSNRRVAKFITADLATSNLELAADGNLPELKLSEKKEKAKADAEDEGSNPWRMLLILCVGAGISAVLLLWEPSGTKTSGPAERARARLQHYYADVEGPLQPYQRYLRDAAQAHARDDTKGERRYYRKVLHLLRAEGADKNPVTGQRTAPLGNPDRQNDKELEELVSILLSTR